MQFIEGGVTAAKGFLAGGIHCGIRKNKSKADLAMIFSKTPCAAAGVYTQNLVKGAPILVTRKNIADGRAQAVICNSGNANTCNADGEKKAWRMCEIAGEALGIDPHDVIVASTGVIGQILPIAPIENAAPALAALLNENGSNMAAKAIMTTDTIEKECAVKITLGDKEVCIGGISKGSGMIHPNMATMLVFVTTDCAITPEMLKSALDADVPDSFNMISIDGDTSTNDMVTVLANGEAGNDEITEAGEDYDAFCAALAETTRALCRMIAADGEGASKLLECRVSGAADVKTAKTVAKSVICSSLLKAAMFGADANWGRVLCAIGYSGADVDVSKIGVSFESPKGKIEVCRGGSGVDFSEEKAKEILLEKEIGILVDLGSGDAEATAWGCDLTYDYVKINGDYRT